MAGRIKALALFSGGLDSTLAAKVILDQGVQVEAVHFVNAFLPSSSLQLQQRIAGQLGIKLHTLDISELHLEMMQRPRYGYGENMNPCVDCRILMFEQAKLYIREKGFSFLVSGEVLGQRPMSQRKETMNIIDRDAQIKGLILRPLSAKLLKPTLAEEEGWVQRDKLFDFSGRSRKMQLALASRLGIKEYSSPAGGCLLTETEFVRKLQDLIASGELNLHNVQLLKIGRHFRLRCRNQIKVIVGRNEEENKSLIDLAKGTDVLLKVCNFAGPITIICTNGKSSLQSIEKEMETAARITAYYSKGKAQAKLWVEHWSGDSGQKQSFLVSPAEEDLVKKTRI